MTVETNNMKKKLTHRWFPHKFRQSIWHKKMPPPKPLCAWCHPNPVTPGLSHGICEFHMSKMRIQLFWIAACQRKIQQKET